MAILTTISSVCTILTFITFTAHSYVEVNWTQPLNYVIKPQPMPRIGALMAVGYDAYNESILLLGGYYWKQFTKFSLNSPPNTFIDKTTSYLSQTTYGYAQHYTQMGDHLWMLSGNSFIDFDIKTYTAYYPDITIPINIKAAGCLASTQNHLIVVGGGNNTLGKTYYLNTVQIYSISGAEWLQNMPTMTRTRASASCIVVNDKLYAIGGSNEWMHDTVERLHVSNINDVPWQQSQSWQVVSARISPLGMQWTRVVSYGPYIIQLGGFSSAGWNYMESVNVIDTETETSQQINDLPFRNAMLAPIIVNDVLHIFGGYTRDGDGDRWVDKHIVASFIPTSAPTTAELATSAPSEVPSSTPSELPTSAPSEVPSPSPSEVPTSAPSEVPSSAPSKVPSSAPSGVPSSSPSEVPSPSPSEVPSFSPSGVPSSSPSEVPSPSPSEVPSFSPSGVPSSSPSDVPTSAPSEVPSPSPSEVPSFSPSGVPSSAPSELPSYAPSEVPSSAPSEVPSSSPSEVPSSAPSEVPSSAPSKVPSSVPTIGPTTNPTPTDAVTTNYEVAIDIASCDEDDNAETEDEADGDSDCQLSEDVIEQAVDASLSVAANVQLVSVTIVDDELVIRLSVTTDESSVLKTDEINHHIEQEVSDHDDFGNVQVEEKDEMFNERIDRETSNDNDKPVGVFAVIFVGLIIGGLAVMFYRRWEMKKAHEKEVAQLSSAVNSDTNADTVNEDIANRDTHDTDDVFQIPPLPPPARNCDESDGEDTGDESLYEKVDIENVEGAIATEGAMLPPEEDGENTDDESLYNKVYGGNAKGAITTKGTISPTEEYSEDSDNSNENTKGVTTKGTTISPTAEDSKDSDNSNQNTKGTITTKGTTISPTEENSEDSDDSNENTKGAITSTGM